MRLDQTWVKLGGVAEDVARKVQLASPNHEIRVEWPEDDRDVFVDARLVYQVFLNLLANAVKYAPDGGSITLRARRQDQELQVSVADRGQGMPPHELTRIFDRFHRVEGESARKAGGTGLGLAICKAFVEAHGGQIWAESPGEGLGSTFHFTIPIGRVGRTPTHAHARGAHDYRNEETYSSRR
jgi:signal transduction histidine kinase